MLCRIMILIGCVMWSQSNAKPVDTEDAKNVERGPISAILAI